MEPEQAPQEPAAPETAAVEPEKPTGASVQFRFSKKLLWWLGSVVVVAVFSLLTWHFKWYFPVYAQFESGSISLKVKEGDKFPLEGAVIKVDGASYTTDSNGKISIAKILKGSHQASVHKDGYIDATQNFTVKRGDNDTVIIALTKVPEKLYSINGVVQDFVSSKSLVDVQVTVAGVTKYTNPNGEYTFPKLAPGDYKVILSKAGYLDKELPVTVKDADVSTTSIPLVPAGQVIFVSNRDGGKRALYVANYDGSDQRQFVTPQNGGEDYGQSISPDNKWVVFSSTRDQVKSPYGDALAKLYIASRDGKDVKKINDDLGHNTLKWSPGSQYLYYQAYTTPAQDHAVQRFYDISKGTVFDLGEDGVTELVFNTAGTSVAFTISVYGSDGQYTNTLKTLNLASGERKTLVTKTGNSFSSLAFSADGSSVSYEMMQDAARHRFQVTISTATEVEVALPPTDSRVYVPSPDGKLKAFLEKRDGKEDLYVVNKDGTNEVKVTSLGVLNEQLPVVWDESGRYLTFAVKREGENALYIAALAGGDPKKVVDFYDDQHYPGYY